MKALKLSLSLSMSRQHSGEYGDSFGLRVTDQDAGVQFLAIDLTPEQFAQLVTGTSITVESEVQVTHVGQIREHQRVNVEVTDPAFRRDLRDGASLAAARTAVARTAALLDAETACEGATPWVGQPLDLYNSHRRVSDTTSWVGFTRYVPRRESPS